ncbi:uncharacterized protein [Ptychodera flava]|uniref:uncharacterized protein n=1 Tax=Ptychodera flava TaxID=63121 RepID=UPI00396A9096
MEQIGKRLGTLTVRDLWLVVVCAIAVYLLRVRDRYTLQPMWRLEIDTSAYENKEYAKEWEQLSPSLITDIESDGINEIVFATREPRIKIAVTPQPKGSSSMLPYLKIQHEASLKRKDTDSGQPVSIATGYLVQYQSMLQIRKQVVVVLTEDWTVLCFDSELKLLWENKLIENLDPKYYIKEATILVTSHNLKKKDGGLVIIGASMTDRHHHESKLVHDHHKRVEDIRPTDSDDDDDEDIPYTKEGEAEIHHFSTYALSGKDGSVRWHHLPGDFDENVNREEALFKAHHFKLALKKGLTHKGESHWSQFNIAMLNSLPHSWQRRSDTSAEFGRFLKSRGDKSKDYEDSGEEHVLDIIGLDEEHLIGYAFGGLRPHSASEHVKNPNAVVIHMQEGIEVLNLASGQPMCRLKLQQDKGVYVDVNQDAILDHVKAHFSASQRSQDNCLAVVKSGHPPHALLFNGSICEPASSLSLLSLTSLIIDFDSNNHYEDLHHTVPPVVVRSVAERRGIWNHLLGESQLNTASKGYDSVFLLSNGRLTSYGPNGQNHWQVETSAKWSDVTDILRRSHHNPEFTRRVNEAFVPGMKALSLQVFGREDVVILTGWEYIVLVSLKDGRILAEHTLPCQPSAPVIIGDFDNNGWNDVIVQCQAGQLGFSLQRYTGYWTTAMIGAAVIIVVTALTSIFSNLEEEASADGDDSQDQVS